MKDLVIKRKNLSKKERLQAEVKEVLGENSVHKVPILDAIK